MDESTRNGLPCGNCGCLEGHFMRYADGSAVINVSGYVQKTDDCDCGCDFYGPPGSYEGKSSVKAVEHLFYEPGEARD